MYDDDEAQMMRAVLDRIPSPQTLALFGRLRRKGWTWEDIEDRLDGMAEDIASAGMPFSDEAERYIRRLLIAAHAYEVGGINN
jgi:hypothetical protein